jgi:hypothetical protein
MNPSTRQRRQIGLPLALGISVGLHLLLLLISHWVPVTPETEAGYEPPEESMLHFSFAPETAEDVEGQIEGEVPIPSEPAQAPVQPDFEPDGAPSLEEPSSEARPDDLLELQEEAIERLEPPPRPEDRSQTEQQPEESEPPTQAEELLEQQAEPEQPPDVDLPEGERNTYRTQPEAETPSEQTPSRSLDVNRALRDFGQALDRSRETRERSESGGGRATNVFVPDHASLPPTGFGAGNLVFESRDYDWSDYARQIYMAIWRAWHNRLYQSTNDFESWAQDNRRWYLEHQSQIRFVILRNGNVDGVVIETPSGCVPLDTSAVDALIEVILPPLPSDFPRDQERVHAMFIAMGEIRSMRPVLTQLKRMGLF